MSVILDRIFDDKRIAIALLMFWLVIVLIGFSSIGLLHSSFVHVGPSEDTKLMSMTIRTWHDWFMVAIASFMSSLFNDFLGDSLAPFLVNVVQDQKTRYLPYSKATCYVIMQLYSIYGAFMSVFSVGLLMSQLDFLLIRLSADLLVNSYTTFKFLRGKEVNLRKYEEESHHCSGDPSDQGASREETARELTDVFSEESVDDKAPLTRTPRG